MEGTALDFILVMVEMPQKQHAHIANGSTTCKIWHKTCYITCRETWPAASHFQHGSDISCQLSEVSFLIFCTEPWVIGNCPISWLSETAIHRLQSSATLYLTKSPHRENPPPCLLPRTDNHHPPTPPPPPPPPPHWLYCTKLHIHDRLNIAIAQIICPYLLCL